MQVSFIMPKHQGLKFIVHKICFYFLSKFMFYTSLSYTPVGKMSITPIFSVCSHACMFSAFQPEVVFGCNVK